MAGSLRLGKQAGCQVANKVQGTWSRGEGDNHGDATIDVQELVKELD